MTWWTYVQRVAGSASAREISRRTGIGQTSVNRWQTSSPKPESVATFAEAYDRPVLEAFIGAGFLTDEQAKVTTVKADLSDFSADDLLAEIRRRIPD
jgi:hypothetical protein